MVNRKFYLKVCYLLYSVLFISCSGKIQINPNSSFRYEDLNNSYDSHTNIFTRKYSNDTIRIKVILTQEEKEKILQSFSENKFQNLPNEIDCSKWGISPKIYNELILNNLTVKYVHNINKSVFCPKGERFNKINILIQNIIINKPEIKKLELSDIAYE